MKNRPILLQSCMVTFLVTLVSMLLFHPTLLGGLEVSQPPAEIKEFRVSIGSKSEGKHLELSVTDPKLIHELLREPLRLSTENLKPVRYEAFATVKILYKDATQDGLVLFLPWGHYKHKNKYRIADFSALKKQFKQLIDEARPSFD